MKVYEIQVSKYGSITIPAKIRKQLGIVPGSKLLVSVEKGSIILRLQ